MCVNLPRWGLKPCRCLRSILSLVCVNLPRWGLKLLPRRVAKSSPSCVNLPRWGLKRKILAIKELALNV